VLFTALVLLTVGYSMVYAALHGRWEFWRYWFPASTVAPATPAAPAAPATPAA